MMAADRTGSQQERRGRIALILAGTLFAMFVANATAGKVSLLLGAAMPVHVGNVAEFLLLVLAVACFVVAILEKERARSRSDQ